MSEFVRVYAPNQLIAAGDEGFFANRTAGRGWLYDGSTGVDTERILALPEIDIGTFHLYPDVYAPKQQSGDVWTRLDTGPPRLRNASRKAGRAGGIWLA